LSRQLGGALASAGIGVGVVDVNSDLIFSNEAMHRFAGDGILIQGSRLYVSRGAGRQMPAHQMVNGNGASVHLIPRRDRSDLFVVANGWLEGPDQSLALIHAFEVAPADWLNAEAVLIAAGLSRAEAVVADHLARGLTPHEIAAALNKSVGTIRVQLRSIYAKLGVNRQSQLMRVVDAMRVSMSMHGG
jgi:DNA-binding CsgD family transcriptional regulator